MDADNKQRRLITTPRVAVGAPLRLRGDSVAAAHYLRPSASICGKNPDPGLRIGPTNTSQLLPYTQSTNGSAPPLNPRLMILSSLAQALPVSSGTNSAFQTIWNTADGAVPS